jgi:hypothetical protein
MIVSRHWVKSSESQNNPTSISRADGDPQAMLWATGPGSERDVLSSWWGHISGVLSGDLNVELREDRRKTFRKRSDIIFLRGTSHR